MRLSSLIAILCIGTFASLNAQRTVEPHFYVGGKGGVSLARTNFSPSVPQSFAIGKTAGVTFRYSEENHFGVICELNFIERGWKETFEDTPHQYSRKLTYIQLPMLTHIFFGSKKAKGFFNLGPEICVLIGDSHTTNFDVNNVEGDNTFPSTHRSEQYIIPDTKKFDYGISAGLGFELVMKSRHSILLEGRFYYGLGNVFPDHKTDYFSASSSMTISVSLGYMFRLK